MPATRAPCRRADVLQQGLVDCTIQGNAVVLQGAGSGHGRGTARNAAARGLQLFEPGHTVFRRPRSRSHGHPQRGLHFGALQSLARSGGESLAKHAAHAGLARVFNNEGRVSTGHGLRLQTAACRWAAATKKSGFFPMRSADGCRSSRVPARPWPYCPIKSNSY